MKDKEAVRQRRKAEAERSEGKRGTVENEREGLRRTIRTEEESLSKETGWQIAPATAAATDTGGRAERQRTEKLRLYLPVLCSSFKAQKLQIVIQIYEFLKINLSHAPA